MLNIVTYAAIGLGAIAFLIIAINVLMGVLRGFKKTLGSLVAIVVSIIVCAIVTFAVCKPDSSLVQSAFDFIGGLVGGSVEELLEIEELKVTVSYYIAMLVAPFFFTLCFIVLSTILTIVMAIVIKFIPFIKKPGLLVNRLVGAALGLVCGYLVAVIVVMPLVGTIDLVTSVADINLEQEEGAEADAQNNEPVALEDAEADVQDPSEDTLEKEELSDVIVAADKYIDVFMSVGCRPVYNVFASADYNGEKIYLHDDIEVIMEVVVLVSDMDDASESEKLDHSHIEMLNTIIDHLDHSPLLKGTISGIFSEACSSWIEGESFMGIEKIDAGELLGPVVDDLFEILSTTTPETVTADLHTMADIFDILIESGLLEDMTYEHMLKEMGKENGILVQLVTAINKNERMQPLAKEISMLSVRALATHLDLPEGVTEEYNVLMSDIASSLTANSNLTTEEKRDIVKEDLNKAFENYGVEIENEALDNVVDNMIEHFDGQESVSDDEIKAYFTQYVISEAGDEYKDVVDDYLPQ